jgi:hypothetical protein
MTTTDTATVTPITRKSTSRASRGAAAAKADAAKQSASAPVPADPKQLAGVTAKPAAAKQTKSAATPKPAAAKTPKPAPAPKADATKITHSAMVRALADLAASWDESTGVSKADALKLISHRAGYMSPKAQWDSRLLPRHIHNGH